MKYLFTKLVLLFVVLALIPDSPALADDAADVKKTAEAVIAAYSAEDADAIAKHFVIGAPNFDGDGRSGRPFDKGKFKFFSLGAHSFMISNSMYGRLSRSPNLGVEKAPAIQLDATGAALYRVNMPYWALACTIRLISTSSPKMPAASVHVLTPYSDRPSTALAAMPICAFFDHGLVPVPKTVTGSTMDLVTPCIVKSPVT